MNKVFYKIMQMPISLWHSRQVIFTKDSTVKREDYCAVWSEEFKNPGDDLEICDYIFEKFNINHPTSYAGRSLSSGDVIVINRKNEISYYLCGSIGWHKLENF